MNWYYVEAGQPVGPVEEAVLDEMVRTGRLQPDTLVWREGMANWQPYREVKPPEQAVATEPPILAPPVVSGAPTGAGLVCCECGRTFRPDEVIRYGGRYVCAACKPVFVQRLAEGAPLGAAAAGALTAEALLAREYRIDIGECLSRAWELFKANTGLIVGTTLVVGLAALAVYGGGTLVSMVIPFFNSLVQMVFIGPLSGGFLWFFLRQVRGERAELADAFAGFRSQFVQLMLCSIVQGLIQLVCFLPMGMVLGTFGVLTIFGGGRAEPGALGAGLLGLLMFFGVVGLAASIYVYTLWIFALPLILDKGLAFWPAMQLSRRMVSKRWWMTFLFGIVAGLLMFAGALACGVGLVVTVPLYYAMWACLYDDNFRDLAAQRQ